MTRPRGRSGICVLSLSLFLLTSSGWAADLTSSLDVPPSTTSTADVPFQLLRGYIVIAKGSIGSLTGCAFLIDTGSSPTIINRTIARRLGLQIQPGSVSQLSGDAKIGSAILPSIALGPISKRNLRVLVADFLTTGGNLGVHVDAVVGIDVLRSQNFVIDYKSRLIIFGQPPVSAYSVPFDTSLPLVTVQARVQGHPVRLLVDTGESGLILFGDDINFGAFGKSQYAVGTSNAVAREPIEVSDLRVGTLYRHRQIAYRVPGPKSVASEFDGLAGISGLGGSWVGFDFDHGILSWN